jgi:Tfp pilus assembly protein PilN
MPKRTQINLLPQEEFEASTLGRTLKWATSTFRIIVILTEMIVMGAFLSRFWLDARNSDLSELIMLESSQIEARRDIEFQFRDLQKKLAIFKDITQVTQPSVRADAISSKLPTDVFLTSVSVQEEETTVRGVAGSDFSVAQLIANLKADTTFREVDLGTVSSSEDNTNLTVFTVRVTY